MDELNQAIEAAGGVSRLAELLGTRQNVVSNWRMRGKVPADKCPGIEAATGVRCEALRPDVTWQRVNGRAVGYVVQVAHKKQHG